MSVITDWTPEKARGFTKENLTFQHELHQRPLFSDEGLVAFDLPEGMHRDSPWALEAIARMLRALPEPDPGAGGAAP